MSFFNGGAVANEVLDTRDAAHQLPAEQDDQYPDDLLHVGVGLLHLHSLSSPCSVVTNPRSFLHKG